MAEHVDRLHLPSQILQVLLEPPPRQPTGHNPMYKDDRPLLRHPSHPTSDRSCLVYRPSGVRSTTIWSRASNARSRYPQKVSFG